MSNFLRGTGTALKEGDQGVRLEDERPASPRFVIGLSTRRPRSSLQVARVPFSRPNCSRNSAGITTCPLELMTVRYARMTKSYYDVRRKTTVLHSKLSPKFPLIFRSFVTIDVPP